MCRKRSQLSVVESVDKEVVVVLKKPTQLLTTTESFLEIVLHHKTLFFDNFKSIRKFYEFFKALAP